MPDSAPAKAASVIPLKPSGTTALVYTNMPPPAPVVPMQVWLMKVGAQAVQYTKSPKSRFHETGVFVSAVTVVDQFLSSTKPPVKTTDQQRCTLNFFCSRILLACMSAAHLPTDEKSARTQLDHVVPQYVDDKCWGAFTGAWASSLDAYKKYGHLTITEENVQTQRAYVVKCRQPAALGVLLAVEVMCAEQLTRLRRAKEKAAEHLAAATVLLSLSGKAH